MRRLPPAAIWNIVSAWPLQVFKISDESIRDRGCGSPMSGLGHFDAGYNSAQDRILLRITN
ncbi:MAG: hypothetical protein VX862_05690, partial [Pseudomonadota bacterium]|nr:hypothetical protein [Pseudomonadota bacterium]